MKYQQFEQFLDEDLGWRKKEISELLMLAKQTPGQEVVIKSLLLLLYAHWEGFIKKSSKLYLRYISEKKVKLSDLCLNFKAVFLKSSISRCIENKDSLSLKSELQFISRFLEYEEKKFKLSIDPDNDFDSTVINTESNLKPKVFKNIVNILGLNYKQALETREHYINSHLLANRNAIGHGSKFDLSKQIDFSLTLTDIEKLKDIVLSIIDNFKEELLEYVTNEYYLASKEVERQAFEQQKETQIENMFKAIERQYSS